MVIAEKRFQVVPVKPDSTGKTIFFHQCFGILKLLSYLRQDVVDKVCFAR